MCDWNVLVGSRIQGLPGKDAPSLKLFVLDLVLPSLMDTPLGFPISVPSENLDHGLIIEFAQKV